MRFKCFLGPLACKTQLTSIEIREPGRLPASQNKCETTYHFEKIDI